MKDIVEDIRKKLGSYNFNSLAISEIDFANESFETHSINSEGKFFDIASITKPLTLGVTYLARPDIFTTEMKLLLEHRGGLIAWGRLSHDTWREQVLSYDIKESETCYSDFGALRLQLEIEKHESPYAIASKFYDNEVVHWLDLEGEAIPTGRRHRRIICGEVHDDNAFVIGEKVCHAGLFATIEGLSRTFLNLNKELKLLEQIKRERDDRFILGWDSVQNPEISLAGSNSTTNTFGHLGFTGTSIWIKPEVKKAIIILTNEVQGYWYDRRHLNALRREIATRALS